MNDEWTVGIIYIRIGSRIGENINILFDGENISFDANLVMYINSTSIPPIMIITRIYENQKLLYIVPLIKHTMVVLAFYRLRMEFVFQTLQM
jgi:hypothetical protein